MHLLAAQPGGIADGGEAVDLGQSPGEIVVLSAADSELSCLAQARGRCGDDFPTLRLANLMQLTHNLSVDTYVEAVLGRAKLVIVRLLGGVAYWPYGVEQAVAVARERGIRLALLPGDDQPDPELDGLSTLGREERHRLWQYCVQGGIGNAANLLAYAAELIGRPLPWREPEPLMAAGLYWPGTERPGIDVLRAVWREAAPVVAIVFYRALVQAGNLAPVDDLIAALRTRGVNPLPLYVTSLKDSLSAELVRLTLDEAPPDVVLNATAFAISKPGSDAAETPFDDADCPVMQVIFAGGTEAAWRDGTAGLSARDIAMNVALPEVDGRLLTRAVSFKAEARFDALTEASLVRYESVPDRIDFVAELAAAWARLRRTPVAERRVALVLANYPNRDGRLGNGVGLDTPAGALAALRAMAAAGYQIDGLPADGNGLVRRLLEGPSNDRRRHAEATESLPLADYEIFFAALPERLQQAVRERWGPPEADPFFRPGSLDCGSFALPARRFGKAVVAIQPARGYNIDPKSSYHDPDLVPPHGYLAFYAWARRAFDAHAIVHFGKHGNLEWLPGKALALSAECWPEAAFGPMPHLYPFIVNDPGEGAQAKRRAQAVIVDHLTPPLTRAESYGPLKALEVLVDEYYEAAGLDPRRLKPLAAEILELMQQIGLDHDLGVADDDDQAARLQKLDAYLCELKEMQIRDGLHVFGASPGGGLLTDLLVALVRVPRAGGAAGDASLLRALAADFGLDGFDPLDCEMAAAWTGARPEALGEQGEGVWRSQGDTVERLEGLASDLVAGTRAAAEAWERTKAVLAEIETRIRPAVTACGGAEMAGLLAGLDGRFVAPGPSGAPTRGRPEVLPTGRNFYSIDTRAVPTPVAWQLGWKSAGLLIERYRQDQGEWPRAIALSAWGTANMRTGGDDIAQALALLGVRPRWDQGSGRVAGFEVLPLELLDRPRVDVTLRISGFFRDAFPSQIALFDSAVAAVAALDEPEALNPLAARVARDRTRLMENGGDAEAAGRRARIRVFGSKPGAYGAGLQALIDERGWESEDDLARAYVAWGGYAYGAGLEGAPEHRLFERRLGEVSLVLQNQDNREHDLLDSDDYYQFEGGITAAVRVISGAQPTVYHNDHSRPESPKIRTLEDEIARVVRARVVNPKWIAGVKRHGYKGAFEMAATVDYLFAFAATARAVGDHHFDLVYDAYLGDDETRAFLEDNNPDAAREIAERLIEAQDRGLWRPRRNAVRAELEALAEGRGE
jgi:cobaltochelatase CobN